jgi:hypothetical protein
VKRTTDTTRRLAAIRRIPSCRPVLRPLRDRGRHLPDGNPLPAERIAHRAAGDLRGEATRVVRELALLAPPPPHPQTADVFRSSIASPWLKWPPEDRPEAPAGARPGRRTSKIEPRRARRERRSRPEDRRDAGQHRRRRPSIDPRAANGDEREGQQAVVQSAERLAARARGRAQAGGAGRRETNRRTP